MKARKENRFITVYSQEQFQIQFNFYNNTHLWYKSDVAVLEADGFFDVVVPIIREGERLGAIYFDDLQQVFAYPIEQIPAKTQAELEEEVLEDETQKYIQRTNDGQTAYAKISAEFRLAKLSGIITEETQKYIESVLIPVRNEVLAGQWISALAILETIGFEQVGQVLYGRLHLQISEYINSNY
jgi:hypothetical protein